MIFKGLFYVLLQNYEISKMATIDVSNSCDTNSNNVLTELEELYRFMENIEIKIQNR